MTKGSLLRAAVVVIVLCLVAGVSFASTPKSYIEKMSGWQSCSVCAGAGGSGPTVSHSMTQGITSPTLGAKSAQYSISGSASYGNALWWKQLGADSSAHNFVYSTYFYLKTPSASQSLEFDVNQSVSGKKYVFGTQCNMAAGTYDVWSASTHWVHTGIACSRPSAYKWHHITLEFQRTSGGHVSFISVTIDGSKHYINKLYSPESSSASELNVAFQMDMNKNATDYKAWLENVTLKYW